MASAEEFVESLLKGLTRSAPACCAFARGSNPGVRQDEHWFRDYAWYRPLKESGEFVYRSDICVNGAVLENQRVYPLDAKAANGDRVWSTAEDGDPLECQPEGGDVKIPEVSDTSVALERVPLPGCWRMFPVVQHTSLMQLQPSVVYRVDARDTVTTADAISDDSVNFEVSLKSKEYHVIRILSADLRRALLGSTARVTAIFGPGDAWDLDLKAYDRSMNVEVTE